MHFFLTGFSMAGLTRLGYSVAWSGGGIATLRDLCRGSNVLAIFSSTNS